ncbi:YciI family protein [Asticcacaulis sp. 201]|uniref:YciI family protein n=1 Tax=Asticcacaulis sp. 201 TaxID=3028787 RepID=UPI002915EB81|nr:YciI family protein [Asticcacaulis sp. 201]MDV6329699.1 YciI family protein [Asticcacaulis sp. 201]
MFIVTLTYKVPNDEVDRYLEGHMAWLKDGYAKGLFLAAGRRVPRTGGMIFANGDRNEVEAMLRADPFHVNGVSDYTISEVNITSTATGLEALKAKAEAAA